MSQMIHPRRFNIGTTAERGVFTLPSDADGAMWWDTDQSAMYIWDGSAWVQDTARVSKVYESDFGAVALESDADGNITINSGTLTLPSDIIHDNDTDTKISFTDDKISFDAGGLNMLALTETTQDLVEIGDVAGGGDVDVNFNNGQAFLQGSDGRFAVGTTSPDKLVHMEVTSGFADFKCASQAADGGGRFEFEAGDGGNNPVAGLFGSSYSAVSEYANKLVLQTFSRDIALSAYDTGDEIHMYTGGRTSAFRRVTVDGTGQIGMRVNSPQGQIHAYHIISGFLLWEYDGLDGTDREIVPNGDGDCLYRLHASYVLRDSSGSVASGTTDVSNSASVSLTVGSNTVRLRVNADGSIDTSRTAGTDTIKVAYTLRWL